MECKISALSPKFLSEYKVREYSYALVTTDNRNITRVPTFRYGECYRTFWAEIWAYKIFRQ